MNLSDLIYVKENVLDHEYCRELILKFNSDNRKQPGTVGSTGATGAIISNVNLELKKCLDLRITGLKEWNKEDKILCKSFNKNVIDYFQYTNKFSPREEKIFSSRADAEWFQRAMKRANFITRLEKVTTK